MSKVTKIDPETLTFDDGHVLESFHDRDCCECHWLSTENLSLEDFEGMEFDLSGEAFFNRVDGYGIELLPLRGWPVRIPGYGSNNGYYSSNLSLVLTTPDGEKRSWDISECQEESEE